MTRAAWFGLILGLAALGAAYFYFFMPADVADTLLPPPSQVQNSVPPEVAEQEPAIQHPMPAAAPEPAAPALPPLEESDEDAQKALRELFGAQTIDSYLIPREPIRRLVLLIDSLDRAPLPLWLRPLRKVPGPFEVDKVTDADGEEQLRLAAGNAQRYAALVGALEAVDAQRLAALYQRYYPLFQDAYDRIGNPRAHYFNDRLIEIIDHLLETPMPAEPIALARPKVVYQFADPDLEARSCGQKALMRMGRDNEARVLAKIREFRSAIVALPKAGSP